MRSAQSSRLDPFHNSHYRQSKLANSAMMYFPKKSQYEKLEETIMNQKTMNLPNIGRQSHANIVPITKMSPDASRNKTQVFDTSRYMGAIPLSMRFYQKLSNFGNFPTSHYLCTKNLFR